MFYTVFFILGSYHLLKGDLFEWYEWFLCKYDSEEKKAAAVKSLKYLTNLVKKTQKFVIWKNENI